VMALLGDKTGTLINAQENVIVQWSIGDA